MAGLPLPSLTLVVLLVWLPVASPAVEAGPVVSTPVVFQEDFSHGMQNWWAEGGVRVWVQDERLHVNADPTPEEADKPAVCTVWCKQPFSGDVRVEFDAHVVSSSTNTNNINLFLHYSDPSGKALYETRNLRSTADYKLYHVLSGNILTFLNDTDTKPTPPADQQKARVRLRHCPGFELLGQAYTYHCRQGVTYHVALVRQGTRLACYVDGNLLLEAQDPKPPSSGLLGLRTFRTYLWWDNIKVTALSGAETQTR
ncbi:DUF1961 family protein [bacterium]|nr:DUF1961 family protein [bacterium]